MIVTTSASPSAALSERAATLARQLGGTCVARRQFSLRQLMKRYGCEQLLVVSDADLRYYDGDAPALYYHPSMAMIRVKRLRSGETDPLLVISGCQPGDTVLDATAGFGADAFVFAYGVGAAGRVLAVEHSPVLAAIVKEGLLRYETGLPDADAALRRIELQQGNHLDVLRQLPAKSVDIVYFDPMFRQPIQGASALAPLRELAEHAPLAREAVAAACGVARRAVVLKEQRASAEFERLGFVRQPDTGSKIAYGVIKL